MIQPVSRARVLLALGTLSAPAVLTLAGLLVVGALDWRFALGGIAVALGLGAVVLREHLSQIARLRRAAVQGAGAGTEAAAIEAAPAARPVLCPGLGEAIAEGAREQRRVIRELEEAIAGDQAIFTALPDPVVMLDGERRILRANPAAEELFDGGLEGRELHTVLRNPELLNAVDQVLRDRGGRVVELTLPGRVVRHLRAGVVRLPGATPGGAAAILTLHDLTALKRAEQMRADFVANASHELRTPLASLLGFIETLQGPARDDTEARNRFLAVMHEQAGRMSRLVEDLLSLSRIELQEHTRPRGTTDVCALVRSVAGTLEPQARDKRMTIELDLAEVAPVAGDRDELAQVFQNLVDNAIKYGRAGTPVRIIARAAAEGSAGARRLGRPGVKVSVVDRSEGIANEHLPRLTERFYRVDTARSRELGGTGLGLAIVKHILNRHRAVLDIDSTLGDGSTFTVYLPAAEARGAGEAVAR